MPPLDTTWSQSTFYLFIHKHLAPLLKRHGWKKLGRTWRLRHDDEPRGWGVINLQKSAWGSRDSISFTINLAVRWDDVPCSSLGTYGSAGPNAHDCHVQERLGVLADAGSDHWWEIDSSAWRPEQQAECVDAIANSVLPLIEERGLPWIQRRLTPRAVELFTRMHEAEGYVGRLADTDL